MASYSHCVPENDLRQPVSWRFPGKVPTVSWANRFPQPCSLHVIWFIESPATVTPTSIPVGQSAIFAWLRLLFFPSPFHRTTSPCGTSYTGCTVANSRFYDVATMALAFQPPNPFRFSFLAISSFLHRASSMNHPNGLVQ